MAESKLTDLIAKLEAATEGSRELDVEIACALRPGSRPYRYAPGTYSFRDEMGVWDTKHVSTVTTSLDAIVALIERKLPVWWVQYLGQTQKGWATRIEQQGASLGLFYSPTPALALCIALLSALQLQGGSEQ